MKWTMLMQRGLFCVLLTCALCSAQKLGEECTQDSECDSNRCFITTLGGPGTCVCNAETQEGCKDYEVCTDYPIASDGEPTCTYCGDPTKDDCLVENWEICRDLELSYCPWVLKSGNCPVEFECEHRPDHKIGKSCYGNYECESKNCYKDGFMISRDSQGFCACNLETNDGCENGEECMMSPIYLDMGPICALPMDATCNVERNGENNCITETCANSVCQCHKELNVGCKEGEICVDDDANGGHTCVKDTSNLLPNGAECPFDDNVCLSGRCFFGFNMEDSMEHGICSCDADENTGCPDGTDCVVDMIGGGPPYCALPDNAVCDDAGQEDCTQGTCCKSGDCSVGVCQAAVAVPMNSKCRENEGCESGYCYRGLQPPMTAGVCECNPGNNDGCADGDKCTISNVIADVPPFCGKALGSACAMDGLFDCETENCFKGECQCNPANNVGCSSPDVCTGDEESGYTCRSKQTTSAPPQETPAESPSPTVRPPKTTVPTTAPAPPSPEDATSSAVAAQAIFPLLVVTLVALVRR